MVLEMEYCPLENEKTKESMATGSFYISPEEQLGTWHSATWDETQCYPAPCNDAARIQLN